MKHLVLVLSTFLIVFSSAAQLKQKLADQHFELLEYAQCVEMYEELAADKYKAKKKSDWENVRRAAICQYKLYNMPQAIYHFEKLHDANSLTEEDRKMFIKALRYNENYGKSEVLIRESANLFPANSFFAKLHQSKSDFDQLFKDSAFYKVKEASINSGKGDFGVAYFGEAITYVSKSENTGFATPKYGWDNDYFLNVMQSNFEMDSSLSKPFLLKHNFISRAHDGPVAFSPDLTEMVITKNEISKKNGKQVIRLSLYFSKNTGKTWAELVPFEFNSEKYDVGHATYSPDGNSIYFTSNMPGGKGGTDIYRCDRKGNSWTEPVNLGDAVNTAGNEMFPFVHDNSLFFASDGFYGLGGLDIFEVNLNTNSAARNIGYPVNTSHDDFGLVFDKSGEIGFLSSNRGDNIDRIYHVKRRLINVNLEGEVYAVYAEKEPVADQFVWIVNMTTQTRDSVNTDIAGKFSYPISIDNEYRVYTKKEEFILLKEKTVSSTGIRKDSTLHCELLLKPTTIQVHLRVTEKESKRIIPDATATITDYNLGWDTTLITNSEGLVTLTVDRNKVYWAHGAKRGFIDADISFNSANENDKVIDIELELPPIKKGEKFKLENIFYDLDKSTLRSESMRSLDKLADFIIKNDLKIELSAHTDSRGSNSYNQRLSQARAQSCVDYLIQKGVKSHRIKAKGYGETQLVNHCKNGVKCSEEEHQENRRTEVKILEVN